jgi:hypothetical protein
MYKDKVRLSNYLKVKFNSYISQGEGKLTEIKCNNNPPTLLYLVALGLELGASALARHFLYD